jgi:tripartite-type tricarboxylate transporter receptor subunit TctC
LLAKELIMKRRDLLVLGLAAAIGLWPHGAPAQGKYPERPIRLIVPFAPGGETDLIGRLWAQKAAPHLGGTIVVENKAGAGGSVGTAEVARARPDGYTLLSGQTTTHVINPIAMSKPPYDPLKDFVPIGVVSTTPTSILVHPSVPAKNLQELIALARANPGKYSFGSAGSGTITNLTGELFKLQAGGLNIVHVPYKGGAPAIQDVVAGHIPMATLILSSALPHHRSGRVRILAVCNPTRVASAPDIPTAAEAGMPGMQVQVFNAIFAPAGTPQPVINALHQATVNAKSEDGFRRELERAGAEMVADSGPEKAAEFIRSEIARWTPIIRASGFKLD